MPKFMIPVIGWTYLVIVLDWYTKKIVSWDIALRSKTEDWKRALEMAVNSEFSEGVRGNGLKLISDNGSQPTSTSFMRDTCAQVWLLWISSRCVCIHTNIHLL